MVVKNVKVINSSKLNSDGTFEIGLRDALLINKNSKITLDKFVYRQTTSSVDTYKKSKIPIKITMTADAKGTKDFSDPSTPISFILNTSGSLNEIGDFLSSLDVQIARHLNGGMPNALNWQQYKYYIGQYDEDNFGIYLSKDVGLDVWSYLDSKTNNVTINVVSYKPTFVAIEDAGCQMVNINVLDDNSFLAGLNDSVWYMAGSYPIVKSAFQMYFEIVANEIEPDPNKVRPWEIGLRDFTKTDYATSIGEVYNEDTQRAEPTCINYGIRVDGDQYYLVNLEENSLTPVGGVDNGDRIMLYSGGSNGKDLEFFDHMTLLIINDIGELKYAMTDVLRLTEGIFLGDHYRKYRMWAGDIIGMDGDLTVDGLTIKNFQATVTNPNYLGLAREFRLDFSEAGSFANELGFSSSIPSTNFTNNGIIIGVQSPSFYAIQDISIYWSLPMLSFIASADKKRNAREKLIATFSPTRSVDRYDSLVYNSSLPYVSIGNNEQLNISSLSFRVLNEYTGEALNSAYLSFNLLIKDENE